MRGRIVPLLAVLAIAGAAVAGFVFFMQNSSPPVSVESTPQTPVENKMEVKTGSNPNPDMSVDANGLSRATVVINVEGKGNIQYKFYSEDAPETSKRIAELINQGFYNGLTFHRVVPGFVVQGGDPNGNGTGGSGQKLKAEFNKRKHVEGTVAMARAADPNSADSQFYFTYGATPHLDNGYTVFGQIISGMDVVRKIAVGDKMVSVVIE